LQHHAKANYFVQLYKKIPIAFIVMVLSAFIVGAVAGLKNGLAFAFGLTAMYFIYELTHRAFHVREPLIRYGLKMRKHHFYHHFGNPKNNHGVTTALWDRVFKTYQKVEQVAVPPKMVMHWLLNEEHTVKSKYQQHFRLR
jgi:4-hydroxysphinganine ceramide fatty acyl 2-hydroxylase